MFIGNGRTWYTASGEQRSKGPYLLLAYEGNDQRSLRALVRTVELRQLGNFMMGGISVLCPHDVFECTRKAGGLSTRLVRKGEPWTIGLSGGFGSDGLPEHVSEPYLTLDERIALQYGPRTPREVYLGVPSFVYERMMPIPSGVVAAFWEDDRAPIVEWARANLFALRKAGDPVRSPFPLRTYQVRTLDVWGNALNGYEINDAFKVGEITFTRQEWSSLSRMFARLRAEDYLGNRVTARCFDVEDLTGDGRTLTIVDNRRPRLVQKDETAVTHGHGRPVLELRRVGGE